MKKVIEWMKKNSSAVIRIALYLASTILTTVYIVNLFRHPAVTGYLTGYLVVGIIAAYGADRIYRQFKKFMVHYKVRKSSSTDEFLYYSYLVNKKQHNIATTDEKDTIRLFEKKATKTR